MARLKTLKPRLAVLDTRSAKTTMSGSWRTSGMSSNDRGYGYKWQKARARFLRAHPLCCYCERDGLVTAATVVDHIVPHRGDDALFWDESNWQSLCAKHHNVDKAEEEGRHKERTKFDANGRVIW